MVKFLRVLVQVLLSIVLAYLLIIGSHEIGDRYLGFNEDDYVIVAMGGIVLMIFIGILISVIYALLDSLRKKFI